MNESHKLIKNNSEVEITIYEKKPKQILSSPKNKDIPLFILIFLLFLCFFAFFKIFSNKNNNIIKNNENNNIIQDIIFENENIVEEVESSENKSICNSFDPINIFNLRLKNGPITICENGESKHICYQNNKGYYNDIFYHKNGVICIMKNIIIDPLKSEHINLIYKGPVDSEKSGFPRLIKGFFNMNCRKQNELENVNTIYKTYFNSWNYKYENKSEKIKELAPGKTVFFISRNQDSPNLFHGNSEIINVISMMDLFHLEPENIQVIFLESITIRENEDPFYEIYNNIISRGGKPIYIKDLKREYHISSAIHIPINWDSPCFFTQESNIIKKSIPNCGRPLKTYQLYNNYINKYLKIPNFIDSFNSDKKIYYYPSSVIKNNKLNIMFTKKITIQWRKVWPKGRKGQKRILGNGPELADKLASILPKNILIRLVDTAALPMNEQISIIRNTDYLVGIHGAGLSLSIFMTKDSILHEILPSSNLNVLRLMSALSGHKTYTDILDTEIRNVDENENVFFNVDDFGENVLNHMKENNFI